MVSIPLKYFLGFVYNFNQHPESWSCFIFYFIFSHSRGFGFDHVGKSWFWGSKLYWEPSQENCWVEKIMCWEGLLLTLSYYASVLILVIHFLIALFQGVNPWIEVDGGVTPKNAYKVSSTFCTWWPYCNMYQAVASTFLFLLIFFASFQLQQSLIFVTILGGTCPYQHSILQFSFLVHLT